jgi:hypothetical protein
MTLKLRVLGWEAKILVLMSVRRSGVREYSVERARRMSFLASVAMVLLVVLEWEEWSEAEEDVEEERRRRPGGDSLEESSGEGSRCWVRC